MSTNRTHQAVNILQSVHAPPFPYARKRLGEWRTKTQWRLEIGQGLHVGQPLTHPTQLVSRWLAHMQTITTQAQKEGLNAKGYVEVICPSSLPMAQWRCTTAIQYPPPPDYQLREHSTTFRVTGATLGGAMAMVATLLAGSTTLLLPCCRHFTKTSAGIVFHAPQPA